MTQKLGLLLLCLLLSACLGLNRKAVAPVIAPLPAGDPPASWPSVDRQLTISLPTVAAMLDSRRVLARPEADRLAYLADVSWADNPPRMLQSALVERLQRSGRLRAVQAQGVGLRGDFVLNLDLLRFEADYSGGGAPRAQVEIAATLLAQRSGTAVASERVVCSQAASTRASTDAARAIGQAQLSCVDRLAGWTLTTLAGAAPPSETSD